LVHLDKPASPLLILAGSMMATMTDTFDDTKLTRKNDPEGNKEDILEIASEEFATHGLSGARVDAIAERTKTSKRMIYYYFGSKEELYLAVLERAYRKIRLLEEHLQLGDLPPEEAMRRLIEATFDHDDANPDFVRLVNIENIHRAEHMQRSQALRELNVSVIQTIADILERGYRGGVFQRRVDPVDLHMMISAQCFFRVSNRHTFGTIFRRDLASTELKMRHKAMIADSVISYLRTA
jgi:AcrR family transcriptional regulator